MKNRGKRFKIRGVDFDTETESKCCESEASPAWFPPLGGVVAGWRWCARSGLWRWCFYPWCCPADSSARAWWHWPQWRVVMALWISTTKPAPTPVWCHWTDSEDPVGSHTHDYMSQNKPHIYYTRLWKVLKGFILLQTRLMHACKNWNASSAYQRSSRGGNRCRRETQTSLSPAPPRRSQARRDI